MGDDAEYYMKQAEEFRENFEGKDARRDVGRDGFSHRSDSQRNAFVFARKL
jgi:hypothetical protein